MPARGALMLRCMDTLTAAEALVDRLLDQVTVAWVALAEQHQLVNGRCACSRRWPCKTRQVADRQRASV